MLTSEEKEVVELKRPEAPVDSSAHATFVARCFHAGTEGLESYAFGHQTMGGAMHSSLCIRLNCGRGILLLFLNPFPCELESFPFRLFPEDG